MIKQDIVHQVIERTGLPRTKAEAAVDTVFEGLKQALAAGERIELRGFGVFSVRARKTGIGRNPRTGTEVSPKYPRAAFLLRLQNQEGSVALKFSGVWPACLAAGRQRRYHHCQRRALHAKLH